MEAQGNPQDVILKLRKRLFDLLALGYMTPESAGTYEQTLLQIHQETERRKQQLMHQATVLRQQADAAEAQGHAFSAMASIMYNIVNGFYEAGQKRLREDEERELERKANEPAKKAEVVLEDHSSNTLSDAPRKRGRPKKS